MSKQSEAKAAQGYTTEKHNCGNCACLEFDMKVPNWMVKQGGYSEAFLKRNAHETNRRCGLGGFAIKKTATCQQWRAKPTTKD